MQFVYLVIVVTTKSDERNIRHVQKIIMINKLSDKNYGSVIQFINNFQPCYHGVLFCFVAI